uniref:Uncharacterized protein n=1 Tax=Mola mola TaxID=94237 RepID=A0A3Q3X4T0_MOLML
MDEDTSDDASPLKLGLTCPVCLSIFEDPVVLPCSHSFCRECLKQSLCPVKTCPLCRKLFEEGGETSNRSLRDVCETFNKYSNWGSGHKAAGEDTCTLHGMPLALYCEKDEEPVCADCVSLHNTHKLWTLKDGVPLCKVPKNPTALHSLRTELNRTAWWKRGFRLQRTPQMYMYALSSYSTQYQAGEAEKQIKADFERLHKALVTEEALRLKALATEEEQKIAAIKELVEKTDKDIVTLNKLIESLKKEMAQWPHDDPQLSDDPLLNMGKHIGALSFKIWKSIQDHVQYNPVVLDPNTASPWLCLNADLTSVKESSERLAVPETRERFDPCVFVLGAEGYTSGKHRWDVIVGENASWIVGVCKESVVRKRKFTISTNRGVWCIGLHKGVYTAFTPERTELQVQQRPERIRIKLDIDKGEVSFWDGEAAKHLVTLKQNFDEKIFPFFGPGLQATPMILTSSVAFI